MSTATEPASGGWGPVWAVLPAFVLTRLAVFFAATSATDSQIYYAYALAAREHSVAYLYQQHDAEYPQLAVVFSMGVSHLADALPNGAEKLISARPGAPTDIGLGRFQVAFGLTIGLIDLGLLLLLARLSHDLEPNDARTQTWRLGLYVAGTAALGPILLDRLDLVVGAAALGAVAALGSGRPWLAYTLLTAGAAFKVVPAVLLPAFVIGAAVRGERFWPRLAREAIVAVGIFALWPLGAVLLGGGERAFVYTQYHSERGLELGAALAAPALLAGERDVGYAFGGYVVRGATADAVARAAPVLTLVGLALALPVVLRAIRRAAPANRVEAVASGCVLLWLVFLLTNKVGSPQYLLWLAPLVPLLALRAPAERKWGVAFVVAGVLATLVYPYLWPQVHGAPVSGRADAWTGPTAFGFALVLARWGVVAVLTGVLAVRLWRTGANS